MGGTGRDKSENMYAYVHSPWRQTTVWWWEGRGEGLGEWDKGRGERETSVIVSTINREIFLKNK